MTLNISQQEAATAAKQILGFYPEIPASDPRSFAAGLVQTLSIFPRAVIERATDPITGIPSRVKFLNLAEIREILEEWRGEYLDHLARVEIATRKALPAPPPESEEMRERVAKGLKELSDQLKSGFGPSTFVSGLPKD